jgi:hypothetical protein
MRRLSDLGLQVVYPLTDEPLGVRRFFVTDPNSVVINVMSHHKRVGEFYGTSTANCRRADSFFPKAGFVQILSSGKSGTPPCKSGQLEKDLGLEASSLRHAARLIIFEIMRSFFIGSKGAGD